MQETLTGDQAYINHIPSWKTTAADSDREPSASGLPSVKMCSNPHYENVTYERLINPMFATNDKLAEISTLKVQMAICSV